MYTSYGLQRDLSEALHKRQRTMLMDDITAIDNTETRMRELARLHGITAEQASAWINTVANDSFTTLPDAYYRISARLRLGLPPADINSHNCHSCNGRYGGDNDQRGQLERDAWHHLNCMQGHGGREITTRHHLIVNSIARYSRLAGAVVIVEPQNLFDTSMRRPDLQITLNYITYLIDVTVINPIAPSVMKDVKNPLAAAKKAEKRKEAKYRRDMVHYDESGNRRDVKFVPFVLETFGGMGVQAQQFLSALSAHSRNHLSAWSHLDVVEGMKKATATAVQRGNGMILLAAYANTTRAFNRTSSSL
jgi:hypothetical protein